MKLTPRIIEPIDELQTARIADLVSIFSTIAIRGSKISIMNISISGSIIYGISDRRETGNNYRDWRFQTNTKSINAGYYEVWLNYGSGKYFLYKSYFHLYTLDEENFDEREYVLLHCDAAECPSVPHSIYKQSPHLHIETAEHPIPKAHIALYNGRLNEVLKSRLTFNSALIESVTMIKSQFLEY